MRTVLTALLLSLLAVTAQAQMLYQEGRHYHRLPTPVATSDPQRVEVVEVFAYTCHHCYNFEPLIQDWKKALPADVNFVHFPGVWDGTMELHARALYTAEALNVVEQMHPAIFRALHVDRATLNDEKSLAELFEKAAGVDREAFDKTFKSFGVATRARQAAQRTREYRITGTPTLIVNGKYSISGRDVGGFDGMLKVADYLIAQERQVLARAAKAE